MKNFQTEVGEWGDATFAGSTENSVVAHLKKEVNELAESHDPEEAADCLLLLLHHAYKCGYDLMIEAFKKFETNKKRRWGRPDKDGVVEHIREVVSSDPIGPNGPPFPI
jgi:NTP pyrophosphatase (non-canonical NTP hydrolase)